MRIPPAQHDDPSWRISEIVPDFELIDAWRLPASGRREDFAALERIVGSLDPTAKHAPRLPALLFGLRRRLGRLFGWDAERHGLPIPGCSERSLRQRLPTALRTNAGAAEGSARFQAVFRTDTESARETSNRTVHAVAHLGWRRDAGGLYHGELGVYVKTRGALGAAYMALINPFRRWIVYPALLREVGRAWSSNERAGK